MAKLNIKLVKSLNGRIAKHQATAEALGSRVVGLHGARSPTSATCSR